MASETTGTTPGTTRRGNGADRAVDEQRDNVRMAAEEARGALETVSRQVPEVARASRSAVDDALRAIEMGSDEQLSAGLTLSLGLAIGLMVGGAPRLLTAAALIPVAAIGMAMVDRQTRARTSGRSGAGTRAAA
jgi:hypothetical protein